MSRQTCQHEDRDLRLPCPHPGCPRGVPGATLIIPRRRRPSFTAAPADVAAKPIWDEVHLERVHVRWHDGVETIDWAPRGERDRPLLAFWYGLSAVLSRPDP